MVLEGTQLGGYMFNLFLPKTHFSAESKPKVNFTRGPQLIEESFLSSHKIEQ